MKNSLFKRAIAVASAVPVALTQCLSVANAVYVDYSVPTATKSAASTTLTLDKGDPASILYIAPEEDYAREGNTFTKSSNWNSRLNTLITDVAASQRNEGVIKATRLYEMAINRAGRHKEVVSSVIDKMSEITYSVSADKKITFEGTLDNIAPVFTAEGSNAIGGALKELAAEYGVEDLETPESFFENVFIGCNVKVVVDASELADGTTAKASFELTDTATGKAYKGLDAIDWALEQLDILKNTAKDACDSYSEYFDASEAYEKIDDSVSFYVDKLEAAKRAVDRAYKINRTFEAETSEEAIARAKSFFERRYDNKIPVIKYEVKRELPDSFAEAAGGKRVQRNYDAALRQLNTMASPYTFDITIDECAALGDSLTDISASVSNGVATFTAKFEDKEAAEVEAYIEAEYNVEVVDIYKTITATANATSLTGAAGGFAVGDVQIERVVIVEDVVTTTSTTSTTSTTDTTETTVSTETTESTATTVTETGDVDTNTTTTVTETGDVDTNTTTTVTETGDVDTNTTTTVTETGDVDTNTTTTVTETGDVDTNTTTTVTETGDVDTNTTTTVTETGDVDTNTTTTVTETGDVDTNTTTTVTETGDVDTNTTTVSTDVIPGSSETTTRTETMYVVNYSTETTTGFYLDIDPEFNIEQVKAIGYSFDYSILSYGEDGSLVSQEILIKGDYNDLMGLVEFKDVPADVFKLINENNVNQFAAQIQLYAKEQIVSPDGMLIAEAGEALTNVNGSPVSVTAYIGVKGDASLDMKADSIDASVVLTWYANVQTGGDRETTQFSNNDLLVQNNPVLDDFAAFLADVDNENDSANYVTLKTARTLDAKDSSYILDYYSKIMTGTPSGRDTWNTVLGEYGKY